MFEVHEIRVEGRLDDRWIDWLEGMAFTRESDGTTTLTGPLADQSALHGVLNRIRDLALPIVRFDVWVPAGRSQSDEDGRLERVRLEVCQRS
jgi:hypothetical protein